MASHRTEPHPLAARTREVCESSTLAIAERAARLRSQGVDVLSFAAGEPDFDTPDFIKKAAADAMAKGLTKYTPSSGIAPLRAAIAEKLRRDQGLKVEPSQVLVSCGGKHAIYNAIHAILDPGDEAIISSPYWTSYPEMVKTADARPVIVPTDEKSGFKLDPARLADAVTPRTRLLLHCSPVNPTGGVYTRDELEGLARVVVDRGLYVLSDEVYEKVVYGATPHISIASLNPEIAERTIVINSCSKTYSMTGWRIGYSAGPRDVMDGAAKIQSQSTSNPTSIAQYGALAAFQGDQSFLQEWVAEFKRRRDVIVGLIRGLRGLTVIEPDGAFYVFPRISALFGKAWKDRKLRNSTDVAEFLLEEARIAVVPGAGFGSDDHIRLSYATSMEKIKEGMSRMARALDGLK